MPIICKICEIEFKSTITNSHLKKHDMTTQHYIELYGVESLSSPEYKQSKSDKMQGSNNPNYGNTWDIEQKKSMSEKMTGKEAWNKGITVTDEHALSNLREGIAKREAKYQSGELIRPTYERTEDIKQKISVGVSKYGYTHPELMSARGKKSIETKVNNGGKLAFFAGKTHSDESKELIGAKSKDAWENRLIELHKSRCQRMMEMGYEILDHAGLDMIFKCNKCQTVHQYSMQYSDACRLTDELCPTCNPRYLEKSHKQLELYEHIKELCPDATMNYREYNGRNEIDIYIPSKSVGFEYNGVYWHSQQVLEANGLSKTRDYEKYLDAKTRGIRIFCIFEDEYKNSKEIVLDRVNNILEFTKNVIYARKCVVKEINSQVANGFIKKYHIQGSGRSVYRIGLYYNDELVSVMTFSNSDITRGLKGWEINRFVSVSGYTIVGGAGKLFANFVKNMNPVQVISYADTRWSDGNVYAKIGFEYSSKTIPNYWYFKGGNPTRIHRYSLRKKTTDTQSLTEYENRRLQGYDRVFDYGSTKWIWFAKK